MTRLRAVRSDASASRGGRLAQGTGTPKKWGEGDGDGAW